MRCLDRNKQGFYYALYASKESIIDEYGNDTGETRVTYLTPVQSSGNISVSKGEAQTEVFGVDVKYDRVIVIDDIDCPITEESILFINVQPTIIDNEYNNDYVVKAIARSLNSVSIAISEVDSNEN